MRLIKIIACTVVLDKLFTIGYMFKILLRCRNVGLKGMELYGCKVRLQARTIGCREKRSTLTRAD